MRESPRAVLSPNAEPIVRSRHDLDLDLDPDPDLDLDLDPDPDPDPDPDAGTRRLHFSVHLTQL
jgi:hypothetical protein